MCSLFVFVTLSWAAAPPEAGAQTEVWISALPVAGGGSGTASNPYDGSTQVKFDARMSNLQGTPNLTIHLGPGTFRSNVALGSWTVRSGWIIQGAGMYSTTCQMMGNLAGRHSDHEFFKSGSNIFTNNVVIRDLTIDCNWSELSLTADMGAGGEKWVTVYAIDLAGSYNLIERVRHINSYGSWPNLREAFGIRLAAPSTGDATGNMIRYCRAESPQGNYGAPFSLHGWAGAGTERFITNSSVYGNYAAGQNTGLPWGFMSGGVNTAFIKNCQIHDNVFIDCQGVYYQDTGSADGIQILNNKVVRGWFGVWFGGGYTQPTWTKKNVTIAGNSLNIQNRTLGVGSASYGVALSGAVSSKISATRNYFSFTPTGLGYKQLLTVSASLQNSTIANNTADEASGGQGLAGPVRGQTDGSNIQISANRTTAGVQMTGLSDNVGSLPAAGQPLNFSTRGKVGTGENVLISGFIITGSSAKKVIVRAAGPSLTQQGVAGALSDSTLALYNSAGALLASNDNWRDSQQAEIIATSLQPSNNLESAIVRTLSPGTYTAVMNGKNGATGIGLVEIYDLQTASSTLGNVSTRGFVGTGDDVLISGIIVGNGSNPTMVARALGPSLAGAGIQNPLADPVLELHDGNGALIAENNSWADTQPELIQATGLAPQDSRDAAIMISPAPGTYTMVLRGRSDTTGVALVEVFQIN
jgi:hypothetical protein